MNADILTPETADFRARVFVNGMVDEIKHGERTGRKVIHSGHWSPHFSDHPWVQASEDEGWGRDLRMSVVHTVKRRIMAGQPYHDIDQLMPRKDWVDYVREKALREKAAMAWRDEMTEKHGTFDAFMTRVKGDGARPLGDVTRDAFRKMQRGTPNRGLHLSPLAELTTVSKRMSGDR